MHGIFRRARKVWGLAANPVDDVEKPPATRGGDLQVFSPEEVWALVRAAASETDAAIFLTAAFTELRMGELLALRWRDVDFAGSAVRVRASYYAGHLTTPKSGKVRAVPMAPDVARALAQLGRRLDWTGEDDLVFPGESGGYPDGSALRRRYKSAATGRWLLCWLSSSAARRRRTCSWRQAGRSEARVMSTAFGCLQESPADGRPLGGSAYKFDSHAGAYLLAKHGANGIGNASDQSREKLAGVWTRECLLTDTERDGWRCRLDGLPTDAPPTSRQSDQLHNRIRANPLPVDVEHGVSECGDQHGLPAAKVILKRVDCEMWHAYLLREWPTGLPTGSEISFVIKDIVPSDSNGPTLEDTVRDLLRLMPRLVARAKRIPIPAQLRDQELAPRHLSLLSYLLFDGPLTVSELAERLEVAPTTVSLIVSDLSRKGVLVRRQDDADRRRRIIDITDEHREAISSWLAPGARAWRHALAPLTPAQRSTFVATLLAYETAATGEHAKLEERH